MGPSVPRTPGLFLPRGLGGCDGNLSPMAEVMSRASSYSRLFGWVFLVGSAFLAADLVCAGLERHLQASPRPFKAVSAPQAAPLRAPSAAGLQVVLRQPVSQTATAGGPASSGTTPSPGAASANSVAPTGLSLKGTVLAGEASVALLEASGQALAVGLNQEVSGYRVTRIEPTWIGLRQGDKAFQLELDSVKEEGPTSAPAAPAGSQAVISSAAPVVPGATAEGPLSLDDIRSQLDNASKMAQQVRVVPKARDGQTYGVLLEFRQPDNLMAKLGLQHGDVLLAVNGSPIRGAEDLYKAYMTLRNAEALEFQVERGQQVTPVRYELAR